MNACMSRARAALFATHPRGIGGGGGGGGGGDGGGMGQCLERERERRDAIHLHTLSAGIERIIKQREAIINEMTVFFHTHHTRESMQSDIVHFKQLEKQRRAFGTVINQLEQQRRNLTNIKHMNMANSKHMRKAIEYSTQRIGAMAANTDFGSMFDSIGDASSISHRTIDTVINDGLDVDRTLAQDMRDSDEVAAAMSARHNDAYSSGVDAASVAIADYEYFQTVAREIGCTVPNLDPPPLSLADRLPIMTTYVGQLAPIPSVHAAAAAAAAAATAVATSSSTSTTSPIAS